MQEAIALEDAAMATCVLDRCVGLHDAPLDPALN